MSINEKLRHLENCLTMQGEDEEETQLLHDLYKEAIEYLNSFDWAESIKNAYLGFGVGKVIGVFLIQFEKKISGSDEWLWVVVGDLPSVYFVVDDVESPADALDSYCCLTEEWADAILNNESVAELFPVQAQPTVENAELLKSRTKHIRKNFIPIA